MAAERKGYEKDLDVTYETVGLVDGAEAAIVSYAGAAPKIALRPTRPGASKRFGLDVIDAICSKRDEIALALNAAHNAFDDHKRVETDRKIAEARKVAAAKMQAADRIDEVCPSDAARLRNEARELARQYCFSV